MYSKISDFVGAYTHESQTTARVLDALTDASLGQEKTEGDWTAGTHAWHIASTPYQITNQFGTEIAAVDKPETLTAKGCADEYRRSSAAVIDAIRAKYTDADLSTEVSAFNYPMPLGVWLNMIVNHEVHHRGQLSILMRQAGLSVPSIYGPNKEETAKYVAEQGAAAH